MADQQLWERTVGGHFVLAKRGFRPSFFSRIVARLQWNAAAIDLAPDAREQRAQVRAPAARRRARRGARGVVAGSSTGAER